MASAHLLEGGGPCHIGLNSGAGKRRRGDAATGQQGIKSGNGKLTVVVAAAAAAAIVVIVVVVVDDAGGAGAEVVVVIVVVAAACTVCTIFRSGPYVTGDWNKHHSVKVTHALQPVTGENEGQEPHRCCYCCC